VAKISNFYGNRNRRKAEDWGIDTTRYSIAADSSFMTDRSRAGKVDLVERIKCGMGKPFHGTIYKKEK